MNDENLPVKENEIMRLGVIVMTEREEKVYSLRQYNIKEKKLDVILTSKDKQLVISKFNELAKDL